MKTLLEKYLYPPRENDGGGGNGAAAAGGAGSDAAAAAGAGAAAGASEGAAAAGAADAGQAGAAASAAELYRPQGVPDTLYGKDDRETMDKMAEALKGYRQRDSDVPDKPDAYKAFDFDKLDPELRPHMEGLANDPIMDAVAKYALEHKIPKGQAQGLIAAAYGEAFKAGVFEGFVDVKAERSALVPDEAKNLPQAQQDAAVEARLQQNEDFIKLLSKSDKNPNGLPPEVADHALLMLMDTAKGNQFIEYIKANLTGGNRAQPISGQGSAAAGGGDRKAALQAKMAAPEMQVGHRKFDPAAYASLMEEFKREFGE